MSSFEVAEPIQNTPYEEPQRYWFIQEGEQPQLRNGRRASVVFPPREQQHPWTVDPRILQPSPEYASGFEMVLVNLIRKRVAQWKAEGYPGLTRTSSDLIEWWHRDGRESQIFYAQREAALTVIFLKEARADFLQGLEIPRDNPSDEHKAEGYAGFLRYACKMATGAGKTTVMGMIAAWSILNKVNDRSDGRFSDVVMVVCPNVTIRERLEELKPERGDASIYRTRDLVPAHLMPQMTQGKVIVLNWHSLEPQGMQTGGTSAKVSKAGVLKKTTETIQIGSKTTTARGKRYMTPAAFEAQRAASEIDVLKEHKDELGHLLSVQIHSEKYVESDSAVVSRVLREAGGKQNILVLNDEAHHAYRIRKDEPDEDEEDEGVDNPDDPEEFFQEATVWVNGLDIVQKVRGINFCLDLSATPYFLGRVGQETNKPFPWVVSDFSLIDAIEAGLVKVPQLAIRDTTGAEHPAYFNIWRWLMEKLTPAERGGTRASPKPEAVLKYAHHPIAMLGGMWQAELEKWESKPTDPRPPVFILVCKNTAIAKVLYEWLAEDKRPQTLPPANVDGFRNRDGEIYTIRVDSKVNSERETDGAKGDESRWMRYTLSTIGKTDWSRDEQGRAIYPDGFEELATKLKRPMHPPGRDVRCIVSVGMLTEGWDCNTVTHIVGLRPFMSQLLCEQVVGRGLRRMSYEVNPETGRLTEEVAKVLGVPFEVIPFKADPTAGPTARVQRHHVHSVPEKEEYEIVFPRVEGYTQAIRSRVSLDWATVPPLTVDPSKIPPEVEMRGLSLNNQGRPSLSGPGKLADASLVDWRSQHRLQELTFEVGAAITRGYKDQKRCNVPTHVLFQQLVPIVQRYLETRVVVHSPGDIKDLFLAPYYGWLIEVLTENLRPDTTAGEEPEIPIYEKNRPAGSTADVSYWTSKDVREIIHSHLNYAVMDTLRWEQSAAYYIDRNDRTAAFVKNQGLGFSIPYLNNGQMHSYVPDFLIRLKGEGRLHLILETKGYDPLADIKRAAAERWVQAVNAEGSYGVWRFAMVRAISDVGGAISRVD
jgi:type III restriction enzyme